MARTRGIGRRHPGDIITMAPNCYERGVPPPLIRSSAGPANALSFLNSSTSILQNVDIQEEVRCVQIPRFRTLPLEIRNNIWAQLANTERVVSIHTTTSSGLRAAPPPILHVNHEARAIALKHYSLSFGYENSSDYRKYAYLNHPNRTIHPPRIYFNFKCDILYFGKDWNLDARGEFSCFDHLKRLICQSDLEKVEKLGFNVQAKLCCQLSDSNHGPFLIPWKALNTLYLGMEIPVVQEKGWLKSTGKKPVKKGEVAFRELEEGDYGEFLKQYREKEVWKDVAGDLDEEAAVEKIRSEAALPANVVDSWVDPIPGHEYPVFSTVLVVEV